jgi:hypothetical protein
MSNAMNWARPIATIPASGGDRAESREEFCDHRRLAALSDEEVFGPSLHA